MSGHTNYQHITSLHRLYCWLTKDLSCDLQIHSEIHQSFFVKTQRHTWVAALQMLIRDVSASQNQHTDDRRWVDSLNFERVLLLMVQKSNYIPLGRSNAFSGGSLVRKSFVCHETKAIPSSRFERLTSSSSSAVRIPLRDFKSLYAVNTSDALYSWAKRDL